MLNSITSRINPKIVIEYNTPHIDIQDYNSVSDRYKLTIKNDTIIDIALGKPIFKRNKPPILYYNIYYINGNQHTKIGIFEVEYNEQNRVALYKNFEKIDIEVLGEPIFFKDVLKETFPELYLSTMSSIEEMDAEIDTFEEDASKMQDYTEEIESTVDDDVITLDSLSEKDIDDDEDVDEDEAEEDAEEEDVDENEAEEEDGWEGHVERPCHACDRAVVGLHLSLLTASAFQLGARRTLAFGDMQISIWT